MAYKVRIDREEISREFKSLSNVEDYIDKILEFLHKYGNVEYQETIKKLVPHCGRTFGTPVPALRIISITLGKVVIAEDPVKGASVLRSLWQRGSREERRIAAEAISYLIEVDPDEGLSLLHSWLVDINNWEICDTIATLGLKEFLANNPEIAFRTIKFWVRSPNPWIRRLGVVSLIPLSSGKYDHPLERFFSIIKMVMQDSNENVQKAVGWVLRSITYKDPYRVGKFLEMYSSYPESSTKRIVKEGSRRLPPEIKSMLNI